MWEDSDDDMVLLKHKPRLVRRYRRKNVLIPLAAIILLILFIYLPTSASSWSEPAIFRTSPADRHQRPTTPLVKVQATFWRSLYSTILNNDPKCDKLPEKVVPQQLAIPYNHNQARTRPDILWMDAPDIRRMKEAHSNFISDLRLTQPKMPYVNGSRGIVTTAGIDQLPVLTISLRMLRRTGCRLPVEVFLASYEEYDEDVCENILPALGAECMILKDIYRAANTGVNIHKYQYKIMSILFSTFEDVLLLDADAFPIYDPTILFDKEPFTSTGLVLWPDFWYASESPYYFQITKLDPPQLHERPSTESGEILYSKPKHETSIMLASYYNYYGPDYYYPLQSQGAPGQGDKETFGWAAAAMGEPFYAVHESVIALGRRDSNGEFAGSAMAQHDPVADFRRINSASTREEAQFESAQTKGEIDLIAEDNGVRPFFVHANYPKFDPATIFQREIWGARGPTMDSNGTVTRCWMEQKEAIEVFGYDLEHRFWQEIKEVACGYEHRFLAWRYQEGLCTKVKKYWEQVFEA